MPYFTTYTGRRVDLLDPDPAEISIDDIAHHLAYQCRFNGGTADHYSVAQHSVIVSRLVPTELAIKGLMHDAAEAYTGDLSSVMKRALSPSALAEFKAIDARITRAIEEALGVDLTHSPVVKHFDRMLLRAESEMLGGAVEEIFELPVPTFGRIEPWAPRRAERLFREAFEALTEPAVLPRLAFAA